MRLVSSLIGLIVFAGCVGPTPPPTPDYVLRVIDAETVAFRASFGTEGPEQALERAFADLGWERRRVEGPGWVLTAGGLEFVCALGVEGEGDEVVLALRGRAPTTSLEERGSSLARVLGDRKRAR